MFEITPLRPGKAFLPVGFQTKARTTISKVVQKIDGLVPIAASNSGSPIKITTDEAITLVDLIAETLDDSEIDPLIGRRCAGD